MTILGWVTIGAGYSMALYLWYMTICFWKLLRDAGADSRRVAHALATLPTLRFKPKAAAREPLLGSDDDVSESCAICLSEYEEGEELRALPCKHVFRRECIDSWISRQGISATCPLCKQLIVASLQEAASSSADASAPGDPPIQPSDVGAVAEAADGGPAEPVTGSVAPLDASGVQLPPPDDDAPQSPPEERQGVGRREDREEAVVSEV